MLVVLAFIVQATLVSAYDGDTITVEAYPWPNMTIREQVRIDGIDAPEIRGQCEVEKVKAKEARDFVRVWLNERVTLEIEGRGKYGRLLAEVILPDGRNLGELLVEQGLARRYDGGQRKGWCS